jgi:hypothetical protein
MKPAGWCGPVDALLNNPNAPPTETHGVTMTTEAKKSYLTRDQVLKALSDQEIASVSTAEAAAHLANGDEYLDLDQLEKGVRRAQGITPPMGRVLPKKAVHADTWNKIVGQLGPA